MKLRKPLIYCVSLILLAACTANAATPALEMSATAEPGLESQKAVSANTPIVDKAVVEIYSTRAIDTGLEVEVCYITPDNAEWYPMPGHLFYGAYEVYPDEFEFLPNETIADQNHPGFRCTLIRYRIDEPKTLTVPVTFSILNLHTIGREMYTPCEEFRQRLGTHSKANAFGLQATCSEANDGSIAVILTEHASSVTPEQAQNLLDEIAKGEIAGPWEFTITEIGR